MATSAIGSICTLAAVTMMPLGDLAVIRFTAPIFSIILARLLREKTSMFKYLFALLILVGVTLVVRPPFLFSNEDGNNPFHGKMQIQYVPQVYNPIQ